MPNCKWENERKFSFVKVFECWTIVTVSSSSRVQTHQSARRSFMKGLGHGIVVVLVVVLANACVVSDGLPPCLTYTTTVATTTRRLVTWTLSRQKMRFVKLTTTLGYCFCRIANLRARRNTRLSAGQLLPCSATLLLLLLLVT